MNPRSWMRLGALVCAAGWGISMFGGNTMGGLVHVLAVLAVVLLVMQARIRVAPTAFETWQTRQKDRRAGNHR